ncbi:MAG: serine--tRNA ligase, partial [Chloroflexi bacterium]|nr:serine--tRNA ligase [Chloroflexota bacterium]
MLDIKLIREQTELVKNALRKRHMDTDLIDEIVALDEKRRALILDVESKKAERNAVSKEIGRMKDKEEREAKIASMRTLGDDITALDEQLKGVESILYYQVATIPNIPDPAVPVGVDDKDNVVVRTVGEKKVFDFEPKPHWDLGPELGIIDFEAGVK